VVVDYTLRPVIEEDWEEFHEMEKNCFEEGDRIKEDEFFHLVKAGNFFALEIAGSIVGELRVSRFGSDEAHIGRVGVARSHQRQGYGKVLMDYAIDWFKKERDIKTVHLYTQDYNVASQSLYRRYGFDVTGTTWSYVVPFSGLEPKGNFKCQEIKQEEIELVSEMFPSLPAAQISKLLENPRQLVLTLKNNEGVIVGAARFAPSFPGCFPFEITSVDCFDDFISGIKELTPSEFDQMRSTFTDNEELAELCGERGYHLHHRLYRMSLNL
jgi:RimJ/RimL family protein N-acetyltransferase